MRSYKVKVAAAELPVTLDEPKNHLKVDVSADDTLITNLIKAATSSCEEYTNRFFITTSLNQYGDVWADISELFKSPAKTITSIKYYDEDNVLQTLSSSIYLLDVAVMPSRIGLQPNQSFPTIANRINAIDVAYEVGVDDPGNVDNGIKQAILLTIGHWYANRESVVVGRQVNEVPMAAKYLLDQYKIQVVR